jgi:lipid A 3-O-deacylase
VSHKNDLPIAARPCALVLLAGLAAAAPAAAQDLSFGLTTDLDHGGVGFVVEYHGAPVIGQPGAISGAFGIAARSDLDGDAWVGAGFVLDANISDNAFVEASFMPGFYNVGETELGGNLQFRTLIGFGWRVSPSGAIVLSLDHMSNAGLERFNPGAETLALRYRMEF